MLKKLQLITTFLVILLLFLFSTKSYAGHISSGEFTYVCVGNNQYNITLKLIRDCSQAALPNNININFTSDCGQNFSSSFSRIGASNVNQYCSSFQNNTICNGGTLFGVQQHLFSATVTLPSCNKWTMSYGVCCRLESVNTVNAQGFHFFTSAEINNSVNACNNSPQFDSKLTEIYCVNHPIEYIPNGSDVDNHTLIYSFVGVRSSANDTLNFQGGYNVNEPLTGITIDSLTGKLNFTPNMIGKFLLSVKVDEYDQNNNHLGFIIRDMYFDIFNCSNSPINNNILQGVQNLSPNTTQLSSHSVEALKGDTINFDLIYTKPDTIDSLSFTSDISNVFSNAQITRNAQSTRDSLVLNVSIFIDQSVNIGSHNFKVDINDNACPIPSKLSDEIEIVVVEKTLVTTQKNIICGNQSTVLEASGGNIFNWIILENGLETPIPVSSNFPLPWFSCNPCSNPIVQPTQTTTFIVESDLINNNRDTITIFVAPDFNPNISSNQNTSCISDTINLDIITSQPFNYSYNWTPDTFLSNDTIKNPFLVFELGGNYEYVAIVASDDGCVKNDTINFQVSNYPSPSFDFSFTQNCSNDSAQFNVSLDYENPSDCSKSTDGCPFNKSYVEAISNGINNNQSHHPTPFMRTRRRAKMQMLFTADELYNLGIYGGEISELSLYMLQKNINVNIFTYQISLMCIAQDSLSLNEGFIDIYQGPTSHVVYNTVSNFSPMLGWNTFEFQNKFNWDGVSNILVDICYSRTSFPVFGSHDVVRKVDTPKIQTLSSDGGSSIDNCVSQIATLEFNMRPLVRFKHCVAPEQSDYSLTWNLPNSLSDSTSWNPYVNQTISGNQNFTVELTDNIGGCSSSKTLFLPPPGTNVSANFTDSIDFNTVYFSNNSQFANSYLWTFGDGDSSTLANPIHTYSNDSVYEVCLYAFNDCSADTFCNSVQVYNAITPNQMVINNSNQISIQYPPTINSFLNLNSNSVVVSGQYNGIYNGLVAQQNNNIIFTANNNFVPGDILNVTVLNNNFTVNGDTLAPYSASLFVPVSNNTCGAFDTLATNIDLSNANFNLAFEFADFNNDGNADVFSFFSNAANSGFNFDIYPGNNDLTFSSPTNFFISNNNIAFLGIYDLNNDGLMDIAFYNHTSNNLSIWINNGNFSFTAINTPLNFSFENVIFKDINNNGFLDAIAYSDFSNIAQNQIKVFFNSGNANFNTNNQAFLTNSSINSLVAFDFNNDGWNDLVYTSDNLNGSTPNIEILSNDNNGNFFLANSWTNNDLLEVKAVADFNQDGVFDLVFSGPDYTEVWLANAIGVYNNKILLDSTYSNNIEIVDIDGDGYLDILFKKLENGSVLNPYSYHKYNATGNFAKIEGDRAFAIDASSKTVDLNNNGSADYMYIAENKFVYFAFNRTINNIEILASDTAICSGSQAVLSAPDGLNNLSWSNGVSSVDSIIVNAAGSYTLEALDNYGCDAVGSIDIIVLNTSFSNISQTICAGQNFENYTVSGNYVDTLVATNGCDSIRTLNLIVTPAFNNSIQENSCSPIVINGFTYSQSGTYYDTLSTSNGCDSILTLNLTIENIDTSVNQNGVELIANANFVSYQWFDCDNNTSLTNENNQSFVATSNGNYAVILNTTNCSDTSSCYLINTVGVEDNFEQKIQLYPNPTSNFINVISDGNKLKNARIRIYDLTGKIIYLRENFYGNELKIEMEEWQSAVYFLEIIQDQNVGVFKVFKN